MANEPTPAPAGPVQQAAADAKVPRLTAKQLECLTLLADGRVRKATTKTNPATDEVNGTTAGSMVAYGYVEGQQLPNKTLFKITPKGLEFLRSYQDKRQMLEAKREAAATKPV